MCQAQLHSTYHLLKEAPFKRALLSFYSNSVKHPASQTSHHYMPDLLVCDSEVTILTALFFFPPLPNE